MSTPPAAAAPLLSFRREKDFFIGIDSDGCVFDSMEIKQKECFVPNIIKHWDLQAVSKYARQTAEFINLYSHWRGINRWPGLVKTFDLLGARPEVQARGVHMPEVPGLRAFIASGFPQSNDGVKAYAEQFGWTADLERGLVWSNAVNACVSDMVKGVPPFLFVRDILERLQPDADLIVVSGTPGEALVREWEEHDISRYVRVIAGQEMGKKSQHLSWAAGGKYAPGRMLMIGDAPGDLGAARAVGALFYPINPGHEEESWERLHREALDRFLNGTYAEGYEDELVARFNGLLPERAPWE